MIQGATGNVPPGRFPSPNARYPFVGPNYQQHGELSGHIYNPWTDKYDIDPKAAQGAGLLPPDPPSPPGLAEQAVPVAIGVGTGVLAKEGATALSQGLLGTGAATPSTVAGTTAGTTGSTVGAGLTSGGGSGFASSAGAATAETQAAWNAGAEAAAPGMMGQIGGTMGLTGAGLLGAAAIAQGANMYNYGGRQVLSGDADNGDYADLLLSSNPVTALVNPALDILGLGTIGELTGLGGKNTKQYQAERWGKVSENSPGWANFYQNQQLAAKEDPSFGIFTEKTDPTGRHIGEKWSFDAAKDIAKEHPEAFIGTYAHAEAFGDKWLSVPEDKQKEFVLAALDEGLYSSDKGSILFSGKKGDLARARELYNEIIGPVDGVTKSEDEDKPKTGAGMLGSS